MKEARDAEAAAREDRDTPAPSVGLALTCDVWADEWLEDVRRCRKPSTHKVNAAAIAKFRDNFCGKALHAVTREEAKRWARRNTWRVPAVVACMNAAIEAEHIARNPFRGLSHRGPGRRYVAPPSVEEVEALANAARDAHGDYGPTLRALVLFLAYSGARVGEAMGRDWQDVDLQGRRALIDKTLYKGATQSPKSGRARRIVLTTQARDAFMTIRRGSGAEPVFTGKRGGRLSAPMLTGYWAAARAAAGLGAELTPHVLRHFAAHHLYVRLGIADHDVAAQLGHTDGGKTHGRRQACARAVRARRRGFPGPDRGGRLGGHFGRFFKGGRSTRSAQDRESCIGMRS